MTNKLFYGDNLEVLREHIADVGVGLISFAPPFNSACVKRAEREDGRGQVEEALAMSGRR